MSSNSLIFSLKQRKDTNRLTQMNSFNQIFQKIKQKMRISQFIANLSRNNIYSLPVQYRLASADSHFLNWKGWKLNNTLENTILILDIVFTLANFVLSTFQAFLDQYQNFKNEHPYIIGLNIIAVIIYFFKTIMSLVTQDVQHGIQYIYLTDIILKELQKLRFYVQVSLAIIILLNIGFGKSDSEALGIIYFVLCLFKIYNLNFSLFKLEIMLVKNPKRGRYWKLMKVFIFNILFSHFTASIFLAMLRLNRQKSWYNSKANITENPGWFELYLWSLYWACTTMITIGYGDFTPILIQQAMIVSALEILSSIIVAYNISQIGSIILSINEGSEQINSKLGLLRRMNNENPVSMELSLTMQEFIIHESTILEEFQYAKHNQLIRSLPMQLQLQYFNEAQKNIFRKTPFFMSLSCETLTKFYLQSQGKVYYPGEYIIQKVFVEQINIVLKGQLGYYYKKPQSSLNQTLIQRITVDYSKNRPLLLARSVFDKTQGIYFDVKATKYSYSMVISTEIFLSILRENQIDYCYYLMTLDIHHPQTTYAFNKCEYCPYFQHHTKFQCPKLHYIPLKSNIIYKYCETTHTNKDQQRITPQNVLRDRMPHVFIVKHLFNKQNLQYSRRKIVQKDFSKSVMIFFGDKKVHQHGFNRALQNMFRQSRNIHHEQSMSADFFDDIDVLADFSHYFTSCNPSKLLNLDLKKRNSKENKPKVDFLVQSLLKNLSNQSF